MSQKALMIILLLLFAKEVIQFAMAVKDDVVGPGLASLGAGVVIFLMLVSIIQGL